ncbi:conserved hypothetical protein [Sporisorium reilianum SRZ2]|uniref:Uncharacterized protein n=1 Tax=Sporisorium reilianum (strain SRZ2) TaxID=999809 RepID=E6ZUP9_SPORE|nr:conserved hypothetical protein [Sporisorium reilianum SRZ2]
MQPLHPYAPTVVVDGAILPVADYVELNGFNLASHTTALEQSVLGKPHLLSHSNNALTWQPPTVCGKRSRSSSDASSSSSSSASVFSPDNEGSESTFDSQTSVGEQTPSSRKSSMNERAISQHQFEHLAAWRADMLAASDAERERDRCAKRIRDLQGEVVRLASEVVSVASQPAAQPAAAAPSAISPASSLSSSSSSTEGSKTALVDCLVDAACRTLDRVWNASAPGSSCELAKGKNALPLQVFVRETLRRGRTSCSTLQAALLYCVRLGQAAEQSKQFSLKQSTRAAGVEVNVETQASSPLLGMTKEELCLIRCPRRMFLASIITAAKFVQDRCYSNKAWSKISGLPVKDLGKLERAFLKAIDYRLMVPEGDWEDWTAELKRAHGAQNATAAAPAADAEDASNGRRSSLSRSQSDNVTGAAMAHDTELRAVSPCLASQVQPKYRRLSDDSQQQQQQPARVADMALPFPRAAVVVSAEI